MAIPIYIIDAFTNEKLTIRNGQLGVYQTVAPPPPIGTSNRIQYLQGRLGSTGLNSGVIDQALNGSVTPQTFYISAASLYDIHILQITVILTDTTVSNRKFGGIPALTTGWDLIFKEDNNDTYLIQKAKSSGSIMVQSGFGNTFGNGSTLMTISNWDANNDAFVITINIHHFVPNGLRIGRGTTDTLRSVVNDDLTGLSGFFVYIYGYKNLG